VRTKWATDWEVRLKKIVQNKNSGVLLWTKSGVTVEHGLYTDEFGKAVHICVVQDESGNASAGELDPADEGYGYRHEARERDHGAGTMFVSCRIKEFLVVGPPEVADYHGTLHKIPGAIVSVNNADGSNYDGWYCIGVVIDTGAWRCDGYRVMLDPADWSKYELQYFRIKTPNWGWPMRLQSPAFQAKYERYTGCAAASASGGEAAGASGGEVREETSCRPRCPRRKRVLQAALPPAQAGASGYKARHADEHYTNFTGSPGKASSRYMLAAVHNAVWKRALDHAESVEHAVAAIYDKEWDGEMYTAGMRYVGNVLKYKAGREAVVIHGPKGSTDLGITQGKEIKELQKHGVKYVVLSIEDYEQKV